jgi:diguanylate cyclase (GGDEF)-like protein
MNNMDQELTALHSETKNVGMSKLFVAAPAIVGALVGAGLSLGLSGPRGGLLGVLCVSLGTVLTGWLFWRNLITPARAFAKRASRIAAGEDLLRFKDAPSHEFSELGTALNQILTRLTETKAALVDGDLETAFLRRELDLRKELEKTNRTLEKRIRDLDILFDTAQAVGSTLELQDVLQTTSDTIGRYMEDIEFTIFLFNPKTNSLDLAASHGLPEQDLPEIQNLSFDVDEGIVGRVFQSGEQWVIEDVSKETAYTSYKGRRTTSGCLVSLPLASGEDRLGVINFGRELLPAFSQDTVKLFETISNLIVVAIQNTKLYERTRELAIHDELTGLYNRRFIFQLLESEWDRSRRFDDPLSVILLDIDHFKKLNDTFGHLAGDDVLKEVAVVLEDSIRRTDTAGRYGGEEFLVLLPKTDETQALSVAEKIRSALEARDLSIDSSVTISAGVCSTTHKLGHRCADLVAAADSMLYRAKRQGRNRVLSYAELNP